MQHADLILINGVIATVDPAFRFVNALAVKAGRICYLGNDKDALSLQGPQTSVIDLKGQLALPGTVDAHIHAAYAGLSLSPSFVKVEPDDAGNLAELNQRIREKAEHLPADAWVIGWGFKTRQLKEWAEEKRLPNWKDIEDGAMGHPVILNDGGLHSMLVSRRAMELAGITKETVFKKEAGKMYRFADGNPTGFFTDFGTQAFVGRAATHLAGADMDACLVRMQQELNRFGITSHNDILGIGGDDICFGTFGTEAIRGYERLRKAGRLTARVFVNLLAGKNGIQSYDTILDGLHEMEKEKLVGDDADAAMWLRADAVKIFGDDEWERDMPPEENGYSMFPGETEEAQAEEMKRTIRELHGQGRQIAIHITGGRGIDVSVEAFKEAETAQPGKDLRHFLLHASSASSENLADCVRYGIGCGAQASGGYEFGGETNYKAFVDHGVLVAEGSDGPAIPMNWLLGLQFLVGRKAKDGKIYRKDLAIGLREAIRMYTIYGAYQNHAEDIIGSLETGKCADIQVLDKNLFEIAPEEIGTARVVMTICDGKIVYQAQ